MEEHAHDLLVNNYETCIYKVKNGDVRTGGRVLKSNGVHPASAATVNLLKSKFVTSSDGDTLSGKQNLKDRARKCKPPVVKEAVVGKLIGNLKDCKAAGASGWRISRIKAIASVLEGLTALTRWVQVWIDANVPNDMAEDWRAVLGIPLRKGSDGQDVRPILIGESLMSLPGACLQHIVQVKVKKLLHASQFGIGVVAGAESMIMACKAMAKLSPDDAFAALHI